MRPVVRPSSLNNTKTFEKREVEKCTAHDKHLLLSSLSMAPTRKTLGGPPTLRAETTVAVLTTRMQRSLQATTDTGRSGSADIVKQATSLIFSCRYNQCNSYKLLESDTDIVVCVKASELRRICVICNDSDPQMSVMTWRRLAINSNRDTFRAEKAQTFH